MSRLSTRSAGPSETIRAAIRPAPLRGPARTLRASTEKAMSRILRRVEDRRDAGKLVEVQALHGKLRLEAPAGAADGRAIAPTAGNRRLARLETHVAEGRIRQIDRDIGRGVDRPAVEEAQQRSLRAELFEKAREAIRGSRIHRDAAGEARIATIAGEALDGHPRLAGGDKIEPIERPAPVDERGAQDDVREFLLREADARQGEVEIERHAAFGHGLAGQAAQDVRQARAAREEGVRIEPPGFELQDDARIVEVDAARPGEAQRRGALPRLDRDGIEFERTPDGPEARIGRDRDRLPRRLAELDSGLPGKGRRRAATRCLRQGELAVDVEARRRLAAADHLDAHRPVRADLAGDEPEWHAGGRALEAPRPGEFLAFDRDLLGIGLIRPAGRKDLRGHEKLRDEQAVDGEVAAFAPAEEIRRQSPAAIGADRDADVGPPDAGLEKADLAAQERRQRNLGPDELGVEGRPLIAGPAEPEAIEAQPRRRQEPDADPPHGVRLGPGRLRDRLVDDVAAGLPVDEGRRDDGRPEDQDHQAREDREDVAQEPPFSALCSRRFTSGGAENGSVTELSAMAVVGHGCCRPWIAAPRPFRATPRPRITATFAAGILTPQEPCRDS